MDLDADQQVESASIVFKYDYGHKTAAFDQQGSTSSLKLRLVE
jgi:hypothetical protein